MSATQDIKRQVFALFGYTGTMQEQELQWLQANGATSDIIDEAWQQFLTAQGYTDPRPEAWYKYLGSLGINKPTLIERERGYWSAVLALLTP